MDFETMLVGSNCGVLKTKVGRGEGHKAKTGIRCAVIVGVWSNGDVLVKIQTDGSLEKHPYTDIKLPSGT